MWIRTPSGIGLINITTGRHIILAPDMNLYAQGGGQETVSICACPDLAAALTWCDIIFDRLAAGEYTADLYGKIGGEE